jgi:hypothetical protein
MKIKQTIFALAYIATIAIGGMVYSQTAAASERCGGADTAIIKCTDNKSTNIKDNGVWSLLMMALNIMTAGVGILAVGGIAYGSALYASSADKPEQAKQGMEYIKNVVIGIVAYGLMYVILNFLIPGGIFKP